MGFIQRESFGQFKQFSNHYNCYYDEYCWNHHRIRSCNGLLVTHERCSAIIFPNNGWIFICEISQVSLTIWRKIHRSFSLDGNWSCDPVRHVFLRHFCDVPQYGCLWKTKPNLIYNQLHLRSFPSFCLSMTCLFIAIAILALMKCSNWGPSKPFGSSGFLSWMCRGSG